MRNLGKLLFQRVVLVSLGILLQIGALLLFAVWLADFRPWFSFLMLTLRVFFTVYLVAKPMDPSYKIAWLIPILAFPVAGVSIYLFMGGNRLSLRERKKLGILNLITEQNLRQNPMVQKNLEEAAPGAARQSRYLKNRALSPVYTDTETTYFPCGEECFPRMLEELRKAERYIFLEYFIVERGEMWDSIFAILKEKARQGVDVRLIYDDFGCITRLPAKFPKYLLDFGISCRVFNPFVPVVSGRLNNRDHRKLMIIDGVVGFTGGINLSDEYINRTAPLGYWKDAGLMLRGKAVWSMTVEFLSMWNTISGTQDDCQEYLPQPMPTSGKGYVQPFSDSPLDLECVGQTVLLNLITSAERSVEIMTPYLVLDDRVTTALCNAAKSGVEVKIITPGIPDKWYVYAMTRSNYTALTAAGVKIYEFTPGFLHSKVFLADGKTAVVGTVNLDYRSLYLHFENAVWMHDSDCIRAIGRDFEGTVPLCREITRATVQKTPVLVRLFRLFLNLFAPMM